MLVCYGSQTGNAEFLAKRVHALIDKDLPALQPKLFCMKDYSKFSLPDFDRAVFVLSSTGEGEPPDNARSFWRFLMRKTHPNDMLARLKFTVLGLGDTNYETFQEMPRRLEERLLELGATSFYKRGEADDATGLEDVVEPWIGGLIPAINASIESASARPPTDQQAPTPDEPIVQAVQDLSISADKPAPVSAPGTSDAAPSAAEASTASAPAKKKIIIRRAPQKDIPDLAPCPFKVIWSEQAPAQLQYLPFIPTSMPAASPLINAELAGARFLTATDAVKQVLEVELHIPAESGLRWTPGDAFAIICPNPTTQVNQVLVRLGLDPRAVFTLNSSTSSTPLPQHINHPCTVRTALTHFVDLNAVPKKSSLRAFAEHATDPKEKERLLFLSSMKGAEDYRKEFLEEGTTFIDLLNDFLSLQPPLEEILDKLPPQQPRYYSHVTSPLASPTTLRFAFSLVRWRSSLKGRSRRGICTDWLYRLSVRHGFVEAIDEEDTAILVHEAEAERRVKEQEGYEANTTTIPLFARPARDFVVPDHAANVIMVGAGTGVAPFLGFVQHRELLLKDASSASGDKTNDWWLFFGCRNENKDFLYREQLEGSVERGVLHKLTVAFSRDTEEVIYVQHRMVEHGAELAARLLNSNASIYVCGDGAGLVKGVNAAVVEILEKFGGLDPAAAKAQHATLLKDRRLLFDVW